MRKNGRGEVTKISKLFDIYKTRFKAPQGTVVQVFEEVILDMFNIEVKKEQCTYTPTTRVLHLSVSGPLKSEILIRKKEIIAHLKGRLGEKSAPQEIL